MEPVKLSKAFAVAFEEAGGYDHMYTYSLLDPIFYIIDSKYRRSKYLTGWLKEQMESPSAVLKVVADRIKTHKDPDKQIKYIQKYVRKYLRYVGDTSQWKMVEYWQTPNQTVKSWQGDCEDGAILIYALARLKGIPANRLMIFAGSVRAGTDAAQGGHAWLAYKPTQYPFNWTFIDWCYYADPVSIEKQNKYTVLGKKILPEKDEEPYNWYYSLWFCFNEEMSFRKLRTQ